MIITILIITKIKRFIILSIVRPSLLLCLPFNLLESYLSPVSNFSFNHYAINCTLLFFADCKSAIGSSLSKFQSCLGGNSFNISFGGSSTLLGRKVIQFLGSAILLGRGFIGFVRIRLRLVHSNAFIIYNPKNKINCQVNIKRNVVND